MLRWYLDMASRLTTFQTFGVSIEANFALRSDSACNLLVDPAEQNLS